MKNVFVLDPIGEPGLKLLCSQSKVVRWDHPDVSSWRELADGVIVRSTSRITADDIAACRRLKAICKQGAGVDKIDVEAAHRHNVIVMNTPGANAESVAELSVGLALALARRIPVCDRSLRLGEVTSREDFEGQGLWGKTVGVIGLGHIGTKVANIWKHGFCATILGYDPQLPEPLWAGLSATAEVERARELDPLLSRADLVSVHAPLTPQTAGLIGTRQLRTMKRSAMLVSTARGGVVDEAALFSALKTGEIYGAALDVFEKEPPQMDHPLFSLPTFVGTCHIGGTTVETKARASLVAAQQLLRVLDGKPPVNSV
ncbi:hydroxyacid dehydrogenase [Roseibium aggregatum]|uniref:Hydroxyacid dehydrogenase n=1 Tax=Roseibium aggregatum TaxID=187304 RepID=A0A939J2F6_9HYPH|nr:hydroxyacid dehydrogenase [Roseibium aggregatum]MBN9669045.1 hydroxyacid dehydrogenase [Roseibium aggregatum]